MRIKKFCNDDSFKLIKIFNNEKPYEKLQQKYFCSICKCTVVFKRKILNLQMFSKNALLYVQILSYFELFE